MCPFLFVWVCFSRTWKMLTLNLQTVRHYTKSWGMWRKKVSVSFIQMSRCINQFDQIVEIAEHMICSIVLGLVLE